MTVWAICLGRRDAEALWGGILGDVHWVGAVEHSAEGSFKQLHLTIYTWLGHIFAGITAVLWRCG